MVDKKNKQKKSKKNSRKKNQKIQKPKSQINKMEFIERLLPILKLQYLKSLSFKQYKPFSIKSASNDEDRKVQFDILKKFCDNAIKANGEIKRLYKFTGTNTWGPGGEGCGRLFSVGTGIQGMPKAIRGFLLDGITSDIDMANAHPVILR